MTTEQLKKGDATKDSQIQVASITFVYDKDVLVHFLNGLHSIGEHVKKEDIYAIGNMKGSLKIKGWSGKFKVTIYYFTPKGLLKQ